MDVYLILEYVVFVGILVSAVYTAESKPISHSIGGFMLLSFLIAVLYILLGAPVVGAFQMAIYSGAVTGLFLLAMNLTREPVEEEEHGE